MDSAPVPETAPDAAAPAEKPRRCDPARVEGAKLRARLMAARAVRRHPGIAPTGRVVGRLGQGLSPLNPARINRETPALSLLLDSDLAERTFDAAASALLANFIAGAITPEALAELPMPQEAQDFALRHRHLSLMPEEISEDTSYDALRAGLVALWADSLPSPLSHEYAPGARPLHLPHVPPEPARPRAIAPPPHTLARRLRELSEMVRPRTRIVLPRAAQQTPPERASAALAAAIATLVQPVIAEAPAPEQQAPA
ncbi:hypothetical protein [Paracoccus sulfuroxidans]|uniref:Uncharacterized protein n=1 Tax=Paracoccus sulfuroxidans TaxID=384678 RepID=A0A562NSU8_9RHOB|nr:hypothetical protein [Paracoccus sulfuroxidans]TWI35141.1 hypothetical protein IQ24_01650 [Paracoccus sulfuroxidans]